MTHRFKELIGFQTEPEVENEWMEIEPLRRTTPNEHMQ